MTKLTLSIDEALIKKAKQIAQTHNTSVSAMFTQFVNSIQKPNSRPAEIGPITRKLSGIIKLPKNKNHKRLFTSALTKKYGNTN